MSSLLSTEIHHQNNLKKLAPHHNSTHSFNFIFAHKGFVCTELLLIMFLLLVVTGSQVNSTAVGYIQLGVNLLGPGMLPLAIRAIKVTSDVMPNTHLQESFLPLLCSLNIQQPTSQR